MIVGVGGLGTPAALWLARTGIGTLGLIDGDAVELSNLQRQVAYRTVDIGRPKVAVAAERIGALHPTVSLRIFHQRLAPAAAVDLFRSFDFVIDATDGIASKYLVNDAAVLAGVPFSHAGAVGFQAQTLTVLPRRSACLRCLFPHPPQEGDTPTCQTAGIVGALVGSVGVLQATEALKSVLGIGSLLANRLLTLEGRSGRWRCVPLSRRPGCPLCGDRPLIRSIDPEEERGPASADGRNAG